VQKAIPFFKDGGSIILNTSVSNVMGLPTFAVYAASKAAVRSFVRGWAVELKDRKIRVNAVSPGPIETPALEKAGLTPEQAEQAAAGFASQVPLGRRGKPEEIAAAVAFLALATDPIVEGGHRVVFLASDDEDAIAPAADLAKRLGFAPVKLGKFNEGGALVHARGRTWGQLIFQDLFKKEQ